jgi:hypothetical protein
VFRPRGNALDWHRVRACACDVPATLAVQAVV